MRGRSDRGGDRGAVAVEFALILPIFLLFVYGTITFGIALSVKQMVSQAAAEGARSSVGAQMIVGDLDQNAAYVRVAAARAGAALGSNAQWATLTPTIETPCPNAAANQASSVCVKVTVSYPYAAHPLIPTLPGLGFVVPSTISSVYEVQVL